MALPLRGPLKKHPADVVVFDTMWALAESPIALRCFEPNFEFKV